MSRRLPVAILALASQAVAAQQTQPPKPPPEEQVQLPPEEDKADIPKTYAFNPLQSKKEVEVGNYYFKKADYRAAAGRFREATHWNDGNAEAWLRLGEAEERNHEDKGAREAYEKYLQLAPKSKPAEEVRKKLEKLKG